jgi:hypothetical protein
MSRCSISPIHDFKSLALTFLFHGLDHESLRLIGYQESQTGDVIRKEYKINHRETRGDRARVKTVVRSIVRSDAMCAFG